MIERAKIGSWLSLTGGILLTYISAEMSYNHFFGRVYMDFLPVPLWYHKFMNDAANCIGYTGLIFGILVMAGAILSFRKNSAFAGEMVSLIFSGLSALVGVVLWLPPFHVVWGRSHIFPRISLEAYAPLFFSGVILGVAGGGITIAPQNER